MSSVQVLGDFLEEAFRDHVGISPLTRYAHADEGGDKTFHAGRIGRNR